MAFLTNHTFGKLCRKVEINKDIDLDVFIKHVYDDPAIYYMLNSLERKYLFKFRALLENEGNFFVQYYKEVPEREDKKQYVYESAGKLKYHTSRDCHFITKDFVDFVVPQEIRDLGDDAVEEYRQWFKDKGYADQYFDHRLKPEKVVVSYNLKFPSQLGVAPLNEGFKLIEERPNSNNITIEESFDYDKFLEELEEWKDHYRNVFSCKVLRTLSKYQYLLRHDDDKVNEMLSQIFSPEFVPNYGIDGVREKLRYSREIKQHVIHLLVDYFKWTFKANDKNFDSLTLESFGLECCGNCKKNEVSSV